MEFKKIRVCGFDKLYDGVMQYANNSNMKGFGDQLYEYLSHISVSFELYDLSTIEVYYLNKVSSSLYIINDYFDVFSSDKELAEAEAGLINTVARMSRDEDVDTLSCRNVLPLGSHRYNVIATFKGSAVIFLTTYEFDTIFREESDGMNSPLYSSYPGNEEIENKLSYCFYKKFFEYISNKMKSLDLVTEFMLTNKYYKFADKYINLASVSNPYGEVSFFGNDVNNMKEQISRITSGYRTSNIKDEIFANTSFQFTCNTNFGIFMNIYLNYKDFVTDHENFKIIFSRSDYSFDLTMLEKFKNQIMPNFEKLAEHRTELGKSSTMDLNEFNYLFGADIIKYSLIIPMNKLDEFIEDLDTNGSIYSIMAGEMRKMKKMVANSIFVN